MALGNMVIGESIDNMYAHGGQILCVCVNYLSTMEPKM